jgi:hypothetical protein
LSCKLQLLLARLLQKNTCRLEVTAQNVVGSSGLVSNAPLLFKRAFASAGPACSLVLQLQRRPRSQSALPSACSDQGKAVPARRCRRTQSRCCLRGRIFAFACLVLDMTRRAGHSCRKLHEVKAPPKALGLPLRVRAALMLAGQASVIEHGLELDPFWSGGVDISGTP